VVARRIEEGEERYECWEEKYYKYDQEGCIEQIVTIPKTECTLCDPDYVVEEWRY